MRASRNRDHGLPKPDSLRQASPGRSQTAPAGYHQGENIARLGAEDSPRCRTSHVPRLLPRSRGFGSRAESLAGLARDFLVTSVIWSLPAGTDKVRV